MKDLLEDLKARKPRIPLPELTPEEKTRFADREDNYESRLRYHYMPQGERQGGGFSRGSDPNMTLDYPFKTMLFWIVSRTNNCQYCLGHQEIKLAVAGLEEDKVAALDGDWERFTPAQQAAFAFARKLTYEPHALNDADIDALRKHYSDLQILEIVLSVSGNNSINRWKEGVGVPQSKDGRGFLRRSAAASDGRVMPIESFLTPTNDKYKGLISKVAPLQYDEKTGQCTALTVCRRPALESRGEVEQQLAACRSRKPRLPVLTQAEAKSVMGDDWPDESPPLWVRLMANFPREGKNRIAGLRAANETGDLTPELKAQVSWIVARQDRAWYATAESQGRLKRLGVSDEQIYALDGSWEGFSEPQRAMFTVARKLAASPIVLTDNEVSEAIKQTSPREVTQLINYVTGRAFFNRLTEAAGLPVEE
jgi:alkylhydroperoxidase family enzyme